MDKQAAANPASKHTDTEEGALQAIREQVRQRVYVFDTEIDHFEKNGIKREALDVEVKNAATDDTGNVDKDVYKKTLIGLLLHHEAVATVISDERHDTTLGNVASFVAKSSFDIHSAVLDKNKIGATNALLSAGATLDDIHALGDAILNDHARKKVQGEGAPYTTFVNILNKPDNVVTWLEQGVRPSSVIAAAKDHPSFTATICLDSDALAYQPSAFIVMNNSAENVSKTLRIFGENKDNVDAMFRQLSRLTRVFDPISKERAHAAIPHLHDLDDESPYSIPVAYIETEQSDFNLTRGETGRNSINRLLERGVNANALAKLPVATFKEVVDNPKNSWIFEQPAVKEAVVARVLQEKFRVRYTDTVTTTAFAPQTAFERIAQYLEPRDIAKLNMAMVDAEKTDARQRIIDEREQSAQAGPAQNGR